MTFNARSEQGSSTQFIHKVNVYTCNENQQTTIVLIMLMMIHDDDILFSILSGRYASKRGAGFQRRQKNIVSSIVISRSISSQETHEMR